MSCGEGHEFPEAYEECPFYKNEYQWMLEIIDGWLSRDVLTKEQREQELAMRREYEQKSKEQEEIDRERRKEEYEIYKRGWDEVYREWLEDDE